MTMTVMAARHVTGRGRVLRVAVVGDKQVGKTSLVTRYSHDVFSPHYTYTQGGDLEKVVVTINDKNVHVTIVDAAGHRYVRSLIKTLYRDVQGILVVYDVTRRATFDSVQEWIRQIELVNTSSPVIFVVGNKQDLTSHRCVPEEEAQFHSERHSVPYYETSARSGHNVTETFSALLREAWQHTTPSYVALDTIRLTTRIHEQEKDNSCCSIT